MTLTLNATLRDARGKKNEALRTAGEMPAVVYGPKHEAQSSVFNTRDFS
jgi:ribosomal protein L25 (general stress protein Ctc)